jgi:hypothetical protein
MVAMLIQPSFSGAAFSVWKNDGSEWTSLPYIQALDLPLEGTLQLLTSDQQVTLLVNEKKVITLNSESLGLERCNQSLGIRWIGASVRPVLRSE